MPCNNRVNPRVVLPERKLTGIIMSGSSSSTGETDVSITGRRGVMKIVTMGEGMMIGNNGLIPHRRVGRRNVTTAVTMGSINKSKASASNSAVLQVPTMATCSIIIIHSGAQVTANNGAVVI